MKIFTKKGILQKTILVILTVLLLNFIVPTYSHAGIGGVLFNPLLDLVAAIGDIFEGLLQYFMTGNAVANGAEGLKDFGIMVKKDNEAVKAEAGAVPDVEISVDDIDLGWFANDNNYQVPLIKYSPEEIFSGRTPFLDINFIDPKQTEDTTEYGVKGSAEQLQGTIAQWYVALRNLAIVILLSVLVYVGIRIVISSTASDKAKYKQMFTDWLVAMCLLFFLHYIMSFTLTMVESINDAIVGGNGGHYVTSMVIGVDEDGNDVVDKKYSTNLMGVSRFMVQCEDSMQRFSYLVIYIALIAYTCIFTFAYLKRLCTMAFLTIMAPMVAMTYPLDKMKDGSAQAFNAWLKEYIFNALIQPFHLIIYTVLVGNAMALAKSNPIFSIAVMGFLLPAEKLLRSFFGFDKAGTLGALKGFAAASALNKLGGGSKGGSKGGSQGGSNKLESSGDKPPRFEKKHDINELDAAQGSSGAEGTDSGDPSEGQDNIRENENQTELSEDNIHDQASEMLAKEQQQMSSQDYRELGMSPQEYGEHRQQELEQQLREEQQSKKAESLGEKDAKKPSPIKNWARHHNITLGGAAKGAVRGAGKAIKGTAKFATKTAFKAGVGTLAAAVTAASGGGLGGAAMAFSAGASLGGKIGDGVIKAASPVASGIVSGVGRTGMAIGGGIAAAYKAESGEKWSSAKTAAANNLLGGTALGRELDIAYGNSRFEDIGNQKEFMKNEDNIQFVKDKMTAEQGYVPSNKDIKERMKEYQPYVNNGLTDVKQIERARKVAKDYGIDSKQSALIAAVGKEKGLTADVLNDDKKVKAQQANLVQEFKDKNISEAEAKRRADYTINVLKAQNGISHNLKRKK